MLQVTITEEFSKRYALLPVKIQKKAEKQERMFKQNPFYPSLHTEKLEPKNREIWSFRIDKNYRVFFRFIENNTVIFLTVGPHDWIYKFGFR
ncbi:MAG: type II toxin-antitoxin system RelE/ParE family toxin [Patescibacteria group bacterium]